MKFEALEHTADIKFKAYGDSLEKAFENAALALKEAIAEKIKVKALIKREIKIKEKDLQSLLYSFLEEFLYLLDANDFLLSKIKNMKITEDDSGFSLIAMAIGDNASNYKFTNDVKAVTYNEMTIKKTGYKYILQFVLDV